MNTLDSLFATISRLSPKYHQLISGNASKVEAMLDASRGRDPLQKKDVSKIFSLKFNGGCSNTQIGKVMSMSDVTVCNVLARKHKLSANWPKHPKERQ